MQKIYLSTERIQLNMANNSVKNLIKTNENETTFSTQLRSTCIYFCSKLIVWWKVCYQCYWIYKLLRYLLHYTIALDNHTRRSSNLVKILAIHSVVLRTNHLGKPTTCKQTERGAEVGGNRSTQNPPKTWSGKKWWRYRNSEKVEVLPWLPFLQKI